MGSTLGKIAKIGKRIVLLTIMVPCLIVTAVVLYFTAIVLGQGYSWSEMDWNSDGTTTISEFFMSADIGRTKDGPSCTLFYSLKDGLPIKRVCE